MHCFSRFLIKRGPGTTMSSIRLSKRLPIGISCNSEANIPEDQTSIPRVVDPIPIPARAYPTQGSKVGSYITRFQCEMPLASLFTDSRDRQTYFASKSRRPVISGKKPTMFLRTRFPDLGPFPSLHMFIHRATDSFSRLKISGRQGFSDFSSSTAAT